jgi:hypothetical protein
MPVIACVTHDQACLAFMGFVSPVAEVRRAPDVWCLVIDGAGVDWAPIIEPTSLTRGARRTAYRTTASGFRCMMYGIMSALSKACWPLLSSERGTYGRGCWVGRREPSLQASLLRTVLPRLFRPRQGTASSSSTARSPTGSAAPAPATYTTTGGSSGMGWRCRSAQEQCGTRMPMLRSPRTSSNPPSTVRPGEPWPAAPCSPLRGCAVPTSGRDLIATTPRSASG